MTVSPQGRPHRPLSPHLQIYRPQLTSVLSILHRLSGIFLFKMAFLWSVFLCIPDDFCLSVSPLWVSIPLIPFVSLLVGALFYHLFSDMRHMYWDMAWGLELPQIYRSGWLILGLSVIFSLGTLIWLFR